MNNPTYQGALIKLLMDIQRLKSLYWMKTKETKIIEAYMKNAINLEEKLVNSYKKNPYELTNFAGNAKFIKAISKQMSFLKKLMNNFSGQDTKFDSHYKHVTSLIHTYKKELDIPPLLLNINNRDFGSYKDLLRKREVIMRAINRQLDMLQREVVDIYKREKVTYDPKIFLHTNPMLVNLLGQKEVINRALVTLPMTVELTISELETCLTLSEKDVKECVRQRKIKGNNQDEKLKNTGKLINYLEHKEQLEKNNSKINMALRELYELQREITKGTQLSEAIRQAQMREAARISAFGKFAQSKINLKYQNRDLGKQLYYMQGVANQNNPLMLGGQPDAQDIAKLGHYNNMLITAHEVRSRNVDAYNQLKLQYANQIRKRIGRGETRSMDSLLREVFGQDIYQYVMQELRTCAQLPLDEIKNVGHGKLFAVVDKPLTPALPLLPGMGPGMRMPGMSPGMETGIGMGPGMGMPGMSPGMGMPGMGPGMGMPGMGMPGMGMPGMGTGMGMPGMETGMGTGMVLEGGKKKKTRKKSKKSMKVEATVKIRKPAILRDTLKNVVSDKLQEQNVRFAIFQNMTKKLEALFGPTSEQYDFIKSVVNNATTDYKTEIMKRYYGNMAKIENEFLKIDVCSNNIKDKLYKYVNIFPSFDVLCQIVQTFRLDISSLKVNCMGDCLNQLLDCSYTRAYGLKQFKEKLYKHLKELYMGNIYLMEALKKSTNSDATKLKTGANLQQLVLKLLTIYKDDIKKETTSQVVEQYLINILDKTISIVTTDANFSIENLVKVFDTLVSSTITYCSKDDDALRVEISDSKNKTSNGIYGLKSGMEKYRRYIENIYVPTMKGFNDVEEKGTILEAAIGNLTNRVNAEEKKKLNNILNTMNNTARENNVVGETLGASVSAINNYMINYVDIFKQDGVSNYVNKLDERYIPIIIICQKLQKFLISLNIIGLVILKNDVVRLTASPGLFNEDILTYKFKVDYWDMQKLTNLHNQAMQYKLQFDALKSNIQNCHRRCKQVKDEFNHMMNKMSHDDYTNCTNQIQNDNRKLVANNLLRKNLSKLQQTVPEEAQQKNIQRLYQNALQIKADKMTLSANLTNKINDVRNLLGSVKICYNNLKDLYSAYCRTIAKGYDTIIDELNTTLMSLVGAKSALECLYSLQATPGAAIAIKDSYYDNLTQMYSKVCQDLLQPKDYSEFLVEPINNLTDNLVNVVQNVTDPNMGVVARYNRCTRQCTQVTLPNIVNATDEIEKDYGLQLDVKPSTLVPDFIAFEYV